MNWATREGYTGPQVTLCGSGINWTGPRKEWGNGIQVHVGHEWPDKGTIAMFLGIWEDAQEFMEEINLFLAENGLPPAIPNDGHTRLSCDGFDTRRFRDDREAGYSAYRIQSAASSLLEYRRDGTTCYRREILESVAQSGIADGFFLKPQDIVGFLQAIS